MLNKVSNIVVFKKPSEHVIQKWQLATQEQWTHIVVMQHVTRPVLNALIDDLKNDQKG
jgi:histidine decarboxylase